MANMRETMGRLGPVLEAIEKAGGNMHTLSTSTDEIRTGTGLTSMAHLTREFGPAPVDQPTDATTATSGTTLLDEMDVLRHKMFALRSATQELEVLADRVGYGLSATLRADAAAPADAEKHDDEYAQIVQQMHTFITRAMGDSGASMDQFAALGFIMTEVATGNLTLLPSANAFGVEAWPLRTTQVPHHDIVRAFLLWSGWTDLGAVLVHNPNGLVLDPNHLPNAPMVRLGTTDREVMLCVAEVAMARGETIQQTLDEIKRRQDYLSTAKPPAQTVVVNTAGEKSTAGDR